MNKPDAEPHHFVALDYNSDALRWNSGHPVNSKNIPEGLNLSPKPSNLMGDNVSNYQQFAELSSHNDKQTLPEKSTPWNNSPSQNIHLNSNNDIAKNHTEHGLQSNKKDEDDSNVLNVLIGLDLSNQAIRNLMRELFDYEFLTILKLNNNNLTTIPTEIGNMKSLVTLDISRNKLQSIPGEIGKLVSLRELFLHKNCLRTLPHELGQLYLLSRLVLDENPFCEPIHSILCDGGAPAVMYYLCEMCPVGPPPADREWTTISECSSSDAVGCKC